MYFQQGIDIVEISRISKIYDKFGINFLIKILSKQELKIIPTQKKRRIDFVSGRFVAKEAIAKALGTGFRNELSFKKISVINDNYGKPEIVIDKNMNETFWSILDASFPICQQSPPKSKPTQIWATKRR